jgi:choline dehydrogenase
MTYLRGDAAEIDAWEDLGNTGWNWASLLPYYKKSERFKTPTESQVAAGATYERQNHGFDGPVHTGYIPALSNGSFAPIVKQTWESLSLPHNPDLNGGDVRGFAMGPQTLDGESGVRWDSARAYYHPVEGRPNLKILRGTVKRITWTPEKRRRSACAPSRLVADGVEFLTEDGKSNFLGARREVVVSAGAVRTPLVLEGSGIGNPRFEADFSSRKPSGERLTCPPQPGSSSL